MEFGKQQELFDTLSHLDDREVELALAALVREGTFQYPISPEADSLFLDVMQHDFPALADAGLALTKMFWDNEAEDGWTNEQATLLGTGFGMAVVLLHKLSRPDQ
jgi:hypothetical protein